MSRAIPFLLVAVLAGVVGCSETSDSKQQKQQEALLLEGTAQVGMPAIKNFRERKILKDIYELRDQTGLVTYSYLENAYPSVIHGHTSLGGKLTFLGETVGYAIPAATQFTNPQKLAWADTSTSTALPQADPNGLFSPSSAEGSWVLMLNPKSGRAEPQYVEPRLLVFTYRLPLD